MTCGWLAYTEAVSALAAYLRDRLADDIRRLAPSERIAVALALGDDDLAVFCAASGEPRARALARLTATRQAGRRLSVSATPPGQ